MNQLGRVASSVLMHLLKKLPVQLLVPQKGLVPNTMTAYSICLHRAALLYSSAGLLFNSASLLLHASPHTDLPKAVKKKKKNFTSFGQPTRLITCAVLVACMYMIVATNIACVLVGATNFACILGAVCLRWLCGPENASIGPCVPPAPPPPLHPPSIHRRHVSSPSPPSHIDTGMQSKT